MLCCKINKWVLFFKTLTFVKAPISKYHHDLNKHLLKISIRMLNINSNELYLNWDKTFKYRRLLILLGLKRPVVFKQKFCSKLLALFLLR